jgi:hypothetical protein
MSKKIAKKITDIVIDDTLQKEEKFLNIDIDVQQFDSSFSALESVDDLDKKRISYMERLIRSSYEYSSYIGYLKNELDITSCAITPGIDIREFNVHLEMHHYPFTLYDIIDIMAREMLAKKKTDKVSMFDICNEVMREHYNGNIGLVPLTKTAHEQAHNNSIKIPASAINGNYQRFILKHKQYISPELLDKATTAGAITIEDANKFNAEKLQVNVLHYNIKYNKQSSN